MFDQQLTFDGGAEDVAPATQQDRLFTAPKSIKGQTAMDTGMSDPKVRRYLAAGAAYEVLKGMGARVEVSQRDPKASRFIPRRTHSDTA